MKSKIYKSADEAIHDIRDGSSIAFGGYGYIGVPENLIDALWKKGIKDLTCVSNNPGLPDFGIGKLIHRDRVKTMILSNSWHNEEFTEKVLSGQLEQYFIPQGTLAEKMRAQGAGIPAFFIDTGIDTVVEHGGLP